MNKTIEDSVAEAAIRLRLSYNQVIRRIMRGELQGRQENGRWAVERKCVDAIASTHPKQSDEEAMWEITKVAFGASELGSRDNPVRPVGGMMLLTRAGRRPFFVCDDGSAWLFDVVNEDWIGVTPIPNTTEHWRQWVEQEDEEASKS